MQLVTPPFSDELGGVWWGLIIIHVLESLSAMSIVFPYVQEFCDFFLVKLRGGIQSLGRA